MRNAYIDGGEGVGYYNSLYGYIDLIMPKTFEEFFTSPVQQ